MKSRESIILIFFLLLLVDLFIPFAFADGCIITYFQKNEKIKPLEIYNQIGIVKYNSKKKTEEMTIINSLDKIALTPSYCNSIDDYLVLVENGCKTKMCEKDYKNIVSRFLRINILGFHCAKKLVNGDNITVIKTCGYYADLRHGFVQKKALYRCNMVSQLIKNLKCNVTRVKAPKQDSELEYYSPIYVYNYTCTNDMGDRIVIKCVPGYYFCPIKKLANIALNKNKERMKDVIWIFPVKTNDPSKVKISVLNKTIESPYDFESISTIHKNWEKKEREKFSLIIKPYTKLLDIIFGPSYYLAQGALATSESSTSAKIRKENVKVYLTFKKYGVEFQLISAKNETELLDYLKKWGPLPKGIEKKMSKYFEKKDYYFIVGHIYNYNEIPVMCYKEGEYISCYSGVADEYSDCYSYRKAYLCSKTITVDVIFPINGIYYPLYLTSIYNNTKIGIYLKGVYKINGTDQNNAKVEYGAISFEPYTQYAISSGKIKDDLFLKKQDEVKKAKMTLFLKFIEFNKILEILFFLLISYLFFKLLKRVNRVSIVYRVVGFVILVCPPILVFIMIIMSILYFFLLPLGVYDFFISLFISLAVCAVLLYLIFFRKKVIRSSIFNKVLEISGFLISSYILSITFVLLLGELLFLLI